MPYQVHKNVLLVVDQEVEGEYKDEEEGGDREAEYSIKYEADSPGSRKMLMSPQ